MGHYDLIIKYYQSMKTHKRLNVKMFGSTTEQNSVYLINPPIYA